MQVLQDWGNEFLKQEPKLIQFKDDMQKVTDYGQLSQVKEANKGVRLAEQYNTFID
jgi:hypothetical protein